MLRTGLGVRRRGVLRGLVAHEAGDVRGHDLVEVARTGVVQPDKKLEVSFKSSLGAEMF